MAGKIYIARCWCGRWLQCAVLMATLGFSSIVIPLAPSATAQTCDGIPVGNAAEIKSAKQRAGKGMREAHDKLEALADDLSKISKEWGEVHKKYQTNAGPGGKNEKFFTSWAEYQSGRRTLATQYAAVRKDRAQLTTEFDALKANYSRAIADPSKYPDEFDLYTHRHSLLLEQDRKLLGKGLKIQGLMGDGDASIQSYTTKYFQTENGKELRVQEAKMHEFRAKRQKLLRSSFDLQKKARKWVQSYKCIKQREAKLATGQDAAGRGDPLGRSKLALQKLWSGRTVAFKEIKRRNKVATDAYNASVANGKKYYEYSVVLIPSADKYEDVRKKHVAQGQGFLSGKSRNAQSVKVNELDANILLFERTEVYDGHHLEFIGGEYLVVATRWGRLICDNLAISLKHFQNTGFKRRQKYKYKDGKEYYLKHPARPTFLKIRPTVRAEAESQMRRLAAALKQTGACGR